jgi:hypothetical protein
MSSGDNVNISPIATSNITKGTEDTLQRTIPNTKDAGGNKIMTTPHTVESFLKAITINHTHATVDNSPIK